MKLLVVVDMQYDFVMPDGALYVPGAEKLILPIINKIFEYDAKDVIYTMDGHTPRLYARSQEAKEFPRHCLFGTKGQRLVVPCALSSTIVHKGCFDVWHSRNRHILARMCSCYDEVEIVGVAADYCVRYAYEGFIKRGVKAYVNPALTVGIKENPYVD